MKVVVEAKRKPWAALRESHVICPLYLTPNLCKNTSLSGIHSHFYSLYFQVFLFDKHQPISLEMGWALWCVGL